MDLRKVGDGVYELDCICYMDNLKQFLIYVY